MSAEIIESIETQLVDLPLKRVHKFSATSITTKAFLLVRIRTRSGIVGIGEATTPGGPWWAGEAIETQRRGTKTQRLGCTRSQYIHAVRHAA